MSKKSVREEERKEAIETLRALCPPGTTVYTSCKHVSRSGMSRLVNCHVIRNGEPPFPRWISPLVAKALDWTFDDKRVALHVTGCGMDIGFHVVYCLSSVLYPNGYGLKCEDCGYRPAAKDQTTLIYAPSKCLKSHKFCGRNGDPTGWDPDGGYALEHQWM